MRSVHVIIVSWNSSGQLLDCLRSFRHIAEDRVVLAAVTVVDNASDDDSMDLISEHFDSIPLRIIRNSQNIGFAAACNQGAAGLVSDFLLFLNPDTELCAGSLERPVDFLGQPSNQSVGIVGVQLLDARGKVTRSCARRPTAMSMIAQCLGLDRLVPSLFPAHFESERSHKEVCEVDQVMGAFLFIRRSLFVDLGGFDRRFFVYFEDLDLSLRARDSGWTSVYLTTARAIHHGCGSTDAIRARRLFYFGRSRILFCLKYFKMWEAVAVIVATLLVEPAVRAAVAIATLRFAQLLAIIQGYGRLWLNLSQIVGAYMRITHA